jgi:hypothetical protein
MNRFVFIVVAFVVVACTPAPALTPAGANVTYVNRANEIEHCRALGDVTIADPVPSSLAAGAGMRADAHDQAIVELRNGAADKGATHVYVDEEKVPSLEHGVAYRCGS